MHNDSIETLLLRHYGPTAATPPQLEEHLRAAVQQDVAQMRQQQEAVARLNARRMSRRRVGVVAMSALGTTGLELLSATLEGLQVLETKLTSSDFSQPAWP
jgi:hypothetical protein